MNDQTQRFLRVVANNPMLLGGALVLGVVIIAALVWESSTEEHAPQQLPKLVEPRVSTQPEASKAPQPVDELAETRIEESVTEPSFEEQALAEEKAAIKPLPPLDESDAEVRGALGALSYDSQLLQWLVSEEVIRKFVRAVENMRQGKLVHKYRPINIPLPSFNPDKIERQYRMLSKDYRRYDPYVEVLAQLDMVALVSLYRRYYPLLQQAYSELGMSSGSFHASLLGAIDHMLSAPVIDGELLLVRPSVMYKYADLAIESLPSTHKLMLRMGPSNTRSMQRSLQRLRQALAE